MNERSPHWGSLEIGVLEEAQTPLNNMIKTELSDTRTFVEQLYRDFTRNGRRRFAARLVESRGDLPWLVVGHELGRLTRR